MSYNSSESSYPTLLYPNGNENIYTNSITIRWNNPLTQIADTYDIYFTSTYNTTNEPNWQYIASVPSTSSSYTWRYDNFVKSSTCRIGIRARNNNGYRSDLVISANNFSIKSKKLPPPTIISPLPKHTYDKYIEIIIDSAEHINHYSQRSYYNIYYSSAKLGLSDILISQTVPIHTPSVIWNTSDLTPSDDYEIRVFLFDNDNNISNSTFIKNINIAHAGFFIVDTTPPIAAIAINSNTVFTNKQEISISVASYDAATSCHSLLFTDGTNISHADTVANIKRFLLDETNGIKYIQLKIQDFGGNRSGDEGIRQRIFETLLENNDSFFIDITIDETTDTLWLVTSGSNSNLYKVNEFPSLISTFDGTATAINYYHYSIYISLTSNNQGILYRFDGSALTDEHLFNTVDSKINTMANYNDAMFIGMENGCVYSFDGISYALVETLGNPIKHLFSDKNLLYLVQKNDDNIYVYNGINFFPTGS